MERKNENKLKMFLAARILLLSNPAILAKIPNSAKFMAALDAAITQINENENELELISSGGNASNKTQLRETLEENAFDVIRKMKAFALFTENTVLMAEMSIPKKMISNVSEIKLQGTVNGLYGRADDHLTELTAYELNVETQKVFRTNIDNFTDAIPAQSQGETYRKEKKRLVDEGFVKGDAALMMLDAGVEIVYNSEPVFYANYKNARKIPELGNGSLQVQGSVTDVATGKPIAGVTITFYAHGQTSALLVKKTAAGGGFNVKSLPEGIYDITVEKTGCKTYTGTFTVVFEDLCRMDIKLDKL
jgi:hypothetical protein